MKSSKNAWIPTFASGPLLSTYAHRELMVFTLTTEAFGISAETTGSTTTTVSTAIVARTILAEALDTVEAWDTVKAQGVTIKVKVDESSICVCPSYSEFAASNLRAIARILQDAIRR
jgi:hypothetical protein